MTNMYNNPGFGPGFLSQNQQDLLMAALQSNLPETSITQMNQNNIDLTSASLDPSMLSVSQPAGIYDDFNFGAFDDPAINDLLDSVNQEDVDFEFDQDQDQDQDDDNYPEIDGVMTTTDVGEKRKSMADGKDDENGAKRRESEEKQAKKPGRKPLTSEPTTKRKAQNRAAQRAFRERKEKHLRDLETKVSELEKTSENTTHENGILRAQVERLQMQLREYRKRLVQSSVGRSPPSASLGSFSSAGSVPMNHFSFDFPRFQSVPYGPLFGNNPIQASPQSTSVDFSPVFGTISRHTSADAISPGNNQMNTPPTTDGTRSQQGSVVQESPKSNTPSSFGDNLFGVRNPSLPGLGTTRSQGYNIFTSQTSAEPTSILQTSETVKPTREFVFVPTSSASPSASSTSQSYGASSSCGTSPEPTTGANKEPTLDTIKESDLQKSDSISQIKQSPNINTNLLFETTPISTSGLDLTGSLTANSNPFLPFNDQDLFSWTNYPESNTAIMADGSFTGGFLNDNGPDLFNMSPAPMNWNDLTGSMRTGLTPSAQKSNPFDSIQPLPKIKEDTTLCGEEPTPECKKLWDEIRKRPDYKDLDIDNLCSELRKKAKCSESGVVITKEDVDAAVQRQAEQSS